MDTSHVKRGGLTNLRGQRLVSRLGCQAHQSNRLMGLAFHGLVLSDKIKGATAVCRVSSCYGRSKEAERDASEPL